MANSLKQSILLDLCQSRIKKYAESAAETRRRTADESKANSEFISAGVLVPVFLREGSLYTLLTLRSEYLPTHKGQVAFPGGKKDEEDKDIVDTALREAQEEVGLPPEIVEVIAVLSPVISQARAMPMYVYPVIGLVKSQFGLVINTSEVQTTFEVPLEFFLVNETHKRKKMTFKDKPFDLHWFYYNTIKRDGQNESLTFHIWGLTATICLRVAMVALSKLPEFDLEEDFSELKHYIMELNAREDDLKPQSRI